MDFESLGLRRGKHKGKVRVSSRDSCGEGSSSASESHDELHLGVKLSSASVRGSPRSESGRAELRHGSDSRNHSNESHGGVHSRDSDAEPAESHSGGSFAGAGSSSARSQRSRKGGGGSSFLPRSRGVSVGGVSDDELQQSRLPVTRCTLVYGTSDPQIHVMQLLQRRSAKPGTPVAGAWRLAFNRYANLLAVGFGDGDVAVHRCLSDQGTDVFSEAPVAALHAHEGVVLALLWTLEGFLVTAALDGLVCVWRPLARRLVAFHRLGDLCTSVDVHPRNPRLLAAAQIDGTIFFLELDDGGTLRPISSVRMAESVTCVRFHPDGHALYAGDVRAAVTVLDVETGRELGVLRMSTRVRQEPPALGRDDLPHVTGIEFHPHRREVLVAANCYFPEAFSTRSVSSGVSAAVYAAESFHNVEAAGAAVYSECGRFVLSASEMGHLYIWDHVGGSRSSSGSSAAGSASASASAALLPSSAGGGGSPHGSSSSNAGLLSPPRVHWRCRLSAPNLGALSLVSVPRRLLTPHGLAKFALLTGCSDGRVLLWASPLLKSAHVDHIDRSQSDRWVADVARLRDLLERCRAELARLESLGKRFRRLLDRIAAADAACERARLLPPPPHKMDAANAALARLLRVADELATLLDPGTRAGGPLHKFVASARKPKRLSLASEELALATAALAELLVDRHHPRPPPALGSFDSPELTSHNSNEGPLPLFSTVIVQPPSARSTFPASSLDSSLPLSPSSLSFPPTPLDSLPSTSHTILTPTTTMANSTMANSTMANSTMAKIIPGTSTTEEEPSNTSSPRVDSETTLTPRMEITPSSLMDGKQEIKQEMKMEGKQKPSCVDGKPPLELDSGHHSTSPRISGAAHPSNNQASSLSSSQHSVGSPRFAEPATSSPKELVLDGQRGKHSRRALRARSKAAGAAPEDPALGSPSPPRSEDVDLTIQLAGLMRQQAAIEAQIHALRSSLAAEGSWQSSVTEPESSQPLAHRLGALAFPFSARRAISPAASPSSSHSSQQPSPFPSSLPPLHPLFHQQPFQSQPQQFQQQQQQQQQSGKSVYLVQTHHGFSYLEADNSTAHSTGSGGPTKDEESVLPEPLQGLDDEATAFWLDRFGQQRLAVPFATFLAALEELCGGRVRPDSLRWLQHVLGCRTANGMVAPKALSLAVATYGPIPRMVANMAYFWEAPWFYPMMLPEEAESFLHNREPKTYLVRRSQSQPGAFGISAVAAGGSIQHYLVFRRKTGSFVLSNRASPDREFASFDQFLSENAQHFGKPFVSLVPSTSFFFGSADVLDAETMLRSQPPGTYLVRFSQRLRGQYVASFVTKSGEFHHSLITEENGLFRFEKHDVTADSLSSLVFHFSATLTRPLVNPNVLQ